MKLKKKQFKKAAVKKTYTKIKCNHVDEVINYKPMFSEFNTPEVHFHSLHWVCIKREDNGQIMSYEVKPKVKQEVQCS